MASKRGIHAASGKPLGSIRRAEGPLPWIWEHHGLGVPATATVPDTLGSPRSDQNPFA